MTLLLFGGGLVFAFERKWLETIGWCAAFIGGSLVLVAVLEGRRPAHLVNPDVWHD